MPSASFAEIVRPRPVPPYLRVVDASACEKGLKSAACKALRDTDSGIADRESNCHLIGGLRVRGDAYRDLAASGEFQSVSDQIVQYLAEPIGVARND